MRESKIVRIKPKSQAARWHARYQGEADSGIPVHQQETWYGCYRIMMKLAKGEIPMDMGDGDIWEMRFLVAVGKIMQLTIEREGFNYWILRIDIK
jgi:hypothetical protein